MDFKRGDQVRFIGASDLQVQWGKNDDPRPILDRNRVYTVDQVEVHSSYTRISLVGFRAKFNSVSFVLL